MSRKSSNVGAAMLQPGRQSQAAGNISVMPAAEMPMVLTLDQLSPNPDNPRTSRNPRYDDIKASIRSRGLDRGSRSKSFTTFPAVRCRSSVWASITARGSVAGSGRDAGRPGASGA